MAVTSVTPVPGRQMKEDLGVGGGGGFQNMGKSLFQKTKRQYRRRINTYIMIGMKAEIQKWVSWTQ